MSTVTKLSTVLDISDFFPIFSYFPPLSIILPHFSDLSQNVLESFHKINELEKKFKTDLRHIKNTGQAVHTKVRKNLGDLCDLALIYNVDVRKIIDQLFPIKYIDDHAITWKYLDRSTNRYIAHYFKNIGIEDNLTITMENDQLQVNRFFFNFFFELFF